MYTYTQYLLIYVYTYIRFLNGWLALQITAVILDEKIHGYHLIMNILGNEKLKFLTTFYYFTQVLSSMQLSKMGI